MTSVACSCVRSRSSWKRRWRRSRRRSCSSWLTPPHGTRVASPAPIRSASYTKIRPKRWLTSIQSSRFSPLAYFLPAFNTGTTSLGSCPSTHSSVGVAHYRRCRFKAEESCPGCSKAIGGTTALSGRHILSLVPSGRSIACRRK